MRARAGEHVAVGSLESEHRIIPDERPATSVVLVLRGGLFRSEGTMTGSGQDNGVGEDAQDSSKDDAVWHVALDWVMRQHEQSLDADGLALLRAWLDADPAHHQAYEQAQQVWRLTGPLPPAEG